MAEQAKEQLEAEKQQEAAAKQVADRRIPTKPSDENMKLSPMPGLTRDEWRDVKKDPTEVVKQRMEAEKGARS